MSLTCNGFNTWDRGQKRGREEREGRNSSFRQRLREEGSPGTEVWGRKGVDGLLTWKRGRWEIFATTGQIFFFRGGVQNPSSASFQRGRRNCSAGLSLSLRQFSFLCSCQKSPFCRGKGSF